MERHDGARRGGGLTEGDVSDDAASADDGDAALAPAGKDGEGVDDVGAGGDLKDVGAEGVGGVAGDDDGGLGFVFGAGGATASTTAGGV